MLSIMSNNGFKWNLDTMSFKRSYAVTERRTNLDFSYSFFSYKNYHDLT